MAVFVNHSLCFDILNVDNTLNIDFKAEGIKIDLDCDLLIKM